MRDKIKTFLLQMWRALPPSEAIRWNLLRIINHKFLVGVAGIVFNQDGHILLLKHSYRKEFPWGLPSGWLKKGEKPSVAIVREFAEETNLKVRVLKPILIESGSLRPRIDLIFLCVIVSGEFRPSPEISEIRFYDPESLPKLLPSQRRIIHNAYECYQ